MNKNSKISVVIPVYMAEVMIEELLSKVVENLKLISDDYEIILVDDYSTDRTWEKISNLKKLFSEIIGLKLSRNFGQHAAIHAGLDHVHGNWIIVMDCDLQDDPAYFEDLYKKALSGWDIVLAKRTSRSHNWLKKFLSKIFYKILGYLTDSEQDSTIANFGIYNQKVIRSLKHMNDYVKYFPTSINWVGFNKTTIDVKHGKRISGKSSYNFKKLINLGLNVVLSFSDKPLRIVVKLGIVVSFISALIASNYLIKYFSGEIIVPGYTSLIISIWFLSGVIITTIGMCGLYIGRIFDQSKNRPVYIVNEKI